MMTMTSIEAQQREHLLTNAYDDFNHRNVGSLLNLLHADVVWDRADAGTRISGQLALRDHWLSQLQHTDHRMVPLGFTHDGNSVTVHAAELVCALDGTLLREHSVQHRYDFSGGRVSRVEERDDRAVADRSLSLGNDWADSTDGMHGAVGDETIVVVETVVVAIDPA